MSQENVEKLLEMYREQIETLQNENALNLEGYKFDVAELTKENELLKADSKRLVETAQNAHSLKSVVEAENSRLREEVQMVMKMADGTDNILLVGRKKWDEVNSQLSAAREALKEIIEEFPNNHSDLPKWKAALTTPQSPESAGPLGNWECCGEKKIPVHETHPGSGVMVGGVHFCSGNKAEPAAPKCEHDEGNYFRGKKDGEYQKFWKNMFPTCPFCPAPSTEPDYYLRMSASEYQRLVEWMKDPDRKDANTAFTSGACRDAARAFQDAKQPAGMKERIEELEKALYYMQNCKYEPDKLLCIYEHTIPLKRRDALREQGREEKGA